MNNTTMTVLLLLAFGIASMTAQTSLPLTDKCHVTKTTTVDGVNYRVDYYYDCYDYYVPARSTEAHFKSLIYVYRINKLELIRVNRKPISGLYVKYGCYEDVPSRWVRKAIKMKNKKI